MSFLEYAPAPESTAILDLRKSYGLFINGEFVDGHGTPFTTISPATEKPIAEIASANSHDVDVAVAAARRAYDRTWSRLSGADRGKYLFRFGASSLLNDVLLQRQKLRTGHYSGPDYVTMD